MEIGLCSYGPILSRAAQYVKYIIADEDTAQLAILESGEAVLTSWDSEWENSSLEAHEQTFPATLLFCSDDELEAWKAERKREADRLSRERSAAYARQREDNERAVFEQLKKKFG